MESNKAYPFMGRGFLSGVNCNDVEDGYIRPNGAISNAPASNGMIVSFSVPEGWCAGQIFFDDYEHLHFRRKWGNSWGSWHKIY